MVDGVEDREQFKFIQKQSNSRRRGEDGIICETLLPFCQNLNLCADLLHALGSKGYLENHCRSDIDSMSPLTCL